MTQDTTQPKTQRTATEAQDILRSAITHLSIPTTCIKVFDTNATPESRFYNVAVIVANKDGLSFSVLDCLKLRGVIFNWITTDSRNITASGFCDDETLDTIKNWGFPK